VQLGRIGQVGIVVEVWWWSGLVRHLDDLTCGLNQSVDVAVRSGIQPLCLST
jgi:hypothetical protein